MVVAGPPPTKGAATQCAAGSEKASDGSDDEEAMKRFVLEAAKLAWQDVYGREWRSDSEGEKERENGVSSSVTIATEEVEQEKDQPFGRSGLAHLGPPPPEA